MSGPTERPRQDRCHQVASTSVKAICRNAREPAKSPLKGNGRMNDTVTHSSVDADRRARVDLAAVYRLLASHGWGGVIFNHAAMRVPPNPRGFFINSQEMI